MDSEGHYMDPTELRRRIMDALDSLDRGYPVHAQVEIMRLGRELSEAQRREIAEWYREREALAEGWDRPSEVPVLVEA